MAKNHLIALGDSHLEALEFAANLGLLDINSSYFSIVPGATAVGLRNPNSRTDAINIFRNSLQSQPTDSHLVIHLGEVDCGFVMWWRAKTHDESLGMQFQASIDAYAIFLSEALRMGFSRICIAGASLPTIRDETDMSEVANKRNEITTSIRDRTELTLKYNRKLNGLARDFNISYFDITSAVLDRSLNRVHDFFRSSDIFDHHLDKHKTVGIWADKCNSFIKATGDIEH